MALQSVGRALMFTNPPIPLSRYLCLSERATVRVRDVIPDTKKKNTGTRAEEAAALLRARLQSLTVPSLQVAEREGGRERRREGASERWSQRVCVCEREREHVRARACVCVDVDTASEHSTQFKHAKTQPL